MKLIRYRNPMNHAVNELASWFRDPFAGIEPLSNFFGHRFRDLFGDDTHLPVDLYEDDNGYIARFHLPGISKKDVQVNLEPIAELVVSYERREDASGGETFVSRASRRLRLRDDADPEAVKATLEDGVLTVNIGKTEAAKSRTIDIA